MRFEEVLPALREGKKIRKRYWCKDNYVYINSNGEFVNQDNKPFAIFLYTLSNLEDDSWEIIDLEY